MPKNKTHSGTAKRVKITGSGKLRRQQTRLRHRLEVKPSTVTRRQSGTVEIAPADVKRVKRLLGRCPSLPADPGRRLSPYRRPDERQELPWHA